MIKKTFLALFVALCSTSTLAANVSMKINGIDGALRDNVDAYLLSIDEQAYSTSLRFQSRVKTEIKQALQALGYYNPSIVFDVENDGTELIVNVIAGDVVRIQTADISIEGEAKQDKDFIALVESSNLKVGAVLNHDDYEGLKSKLHSLALQKGYFDADFTEKSLLVSPALNQAVIHLHYNSGIRYQFGATSISGSQIELDRVQSLQTYKQGEPYLINNVATYNQALSNTDWFSSVYVGPDLDSLGQGRQLPMKVKLAPQARDQLETGIGYSTDVGVKGTLKWKKPWINDKGHSFDSSLSLSQPEQQITAGYKIPLEDVANQYYRIQYGMKKVDNRDTNSLESNLSFERHWQLENGWHRTAFVRYLVESYSQGLQDDTGQFVMPGMTFTRTRFRGGSMPYWGDKQTITMEYGDDALLSETRVFRVQGRTMWIRSLNKNHRGLFRLEGGANITEEFDKLSPSLRFFAGGDNNLRGYSYESISPKDASGALTGAKYTATSTLEYQYRLVGDWWLALFTDYGDAFNTTPDWKLGTGVGVRWASPVGPVSLDFAWGLDEDPGDRFQIHFSLGPEL